MIVECGQCSTKFKIADEKVTDRGVKVRCSKCKHLFMVKKEGVTELDEPQSKSPGETQKKPAAPDGLGVPDSVFKAPTKVAPPGSPPSIPSVATKKGDIFSKPTRVAQAPTRPESPGNPPKSPVPPPAFLGTGNKSLADQIDLDSEEEPKAFSQPSPSFSAASPSSLPPKPQAPASPPISAIPKTPLPPPPAARHKANIGPQLPPPPAGIKSDLSDDLFGDLGSLESEGSAPSVPVANPPAPPAPPAKPSEPPVKSAGPPAKPSEPPVRPAGPPARPPEPPVRPAGPPAKPPEPPVKPAAPPALSSAPAPSPSLDDPFAGIDISDSPSATVAESTEGLDAGRGSSPSDPVSGEAVGKPTSDLFGDLGDPFATLPDPLQSTEPIGSAVGGGPEGGSSPAAPDDPFASIDTASEAPSVAPAAVPDTAPSADPFASLDATQDQSTTAFGGDLTDNDPFGQLDTSTDGGESEPSGLQLGEDGRLTGEDLPEPPAQTKTLAPTVAEHGGATAAPQTAPPAPMSLAKRADGISARPPSLWLYKVGFGVIGLLMLLLLFVAYRSGGKPDLTSWSTYVRAFTGRSSSQVAAGELVVTKMDNTIYPNRDGHPLLILWGEVQSQTDSEKKAVTVTAMLMDKRGHVGDRKTVPVGLTFTPEEVFLMLDGPAVDAAYRVKLSQEKKSSISPGGKAAFMVIFFDHPDKMRDMEFKVEAKTSSDPLLGLPPVPDTPEEEASERAEGAMTTKKKDPTNTATAPVLVEKRGNFVRMKPKARKPTVDN